MQLQNIFRYPIKSLGGQSLSSALALQRGFEFDRRWMLVDEAGEFISQRVEHQLALLQTEIENDGILVYNKHLPKHNLFIPFENRAEQRINVSVWDDQVSAQAVNDPKIDAWFSDFLQKTCRLVHLPETGSRAVDLRYAKNGEQVSFADAFPYLLINQASLNDLNGRLENPVPMNRFRPNLVVKGTKAFEEDEWAEIKIGEVHFKVAKPCARCILTTVDQSTGIKGKEPLLTLSTYRIVDNKVLFGQNLIALNEGSISVNDPVEILKLKSIE